MLQLENLHIPSITLNKQKLVLLISQQVDFAKEFSIDLILITLESAGIYH